MKKTKLQYIKKDKLNLEGVYMELKTQWYKSIDKRTSRRTYIDKDLNLDYLNKISSLIDKINKESSLNIQLIKDGEKPFKGIKKSYGMISGVKSFIALVGEENIINVESKIGYFGEALVLECTSLGIGTCWIGGTYDKKEVENKIDIKENEKLYCVISIGYVKEEKGIKEKLLSSFSKNRKSSNEILSCNEKEVPNWVKNGIEAVRKAPSAINKQPWKYEYSKGIIKAFIDGQKHGYEKIDLGISMLHFQLGAKNSGYVGNWEYINNINIFK